NSRGSTFMDSVEGLAERHAEGQMDINATTATAVRRPYAGRNWNDMCRTVHSAATNRVNGLLGRVAGSTLRRSIWRMTRAETSGTGRESTNALVSRMTLSTARMSARSSAVS